VFVTIVALLAVALMPVDMALAQQANPGRTLPDTVERGETFTVVVSFTAPVDNFNSIGITDLAPAGWNVTVDTTWCTPNAYAVEARGNKPEILWSGPFSNGTSFTALYKVTVPVTATPGVNTFPYNDCSEGWLEYYLGEEGPFLENITGDSQVELPAANPDRVLPDSVQGGKTFDVTVTFTAPVDNFNAVGLTDIAPAGWDVTVDKTWCTPNADAVEATDNKAEIAWHGEPEVGFDKDTSFSALYRVTVPDDASAGIHTFDGFLEYYLASEGPYREDITGDSEVEVTVSATPLISCSPKSLSFSATQGGSNPADQTLEIWNAGGGTLSWSVTDGAAWLSENPTGGSSTGEHDTVAVSVDITGMSTGDYSAKITITAGGASNSPQKVPVSLHIGSPAPKISFSPESLSFTAVEGGSNPANETLEIWNSGVETLHWTLSDDAAGWLSESPTSGSSMSERDTVVLSVDTTGMSTGNYSANITITADGASNSPQVVVVGLYIASASPPSPPPPSSVQPWLNRYWWTIVAGIGAVVLLVYLLRRRRGA